MRSLLSEWERHRKADAALQLTPLRDDLDWLLAGEPDPDVSIDFWVLCTDETSAAEISRHLLNFSNNYLSTFLLSGWVDAFIGRIIVKDKDLGQAFIKEFWKKSRPAHGRVRAYQALVLVKGGHRDHWLNATSWMQNFENVLIRTERKISVLSGVHWKNTSIARIMFGVPAYRTNI
jgi:hypothetical protein